MISMVTETSKLDPEDGIKFRGYSLDELMSYYQHMVMENNQCLREYFI